MDTIEETTLDQLLSSGDGQPITPEHRAWMNEQIQNALDHKRSGKATYSSLDDVRRKFGM
jgi:hypothetical protein